MLTFITCAFLVIINGFTTVIHGQEYVTSTPPTSETTTTTTANKCRTPNETLSPCGCENYCTLGELCKPCMQPPPMICQCSEGYVRDDNAMTWKCVLPQDCSCKDPNEVYKNCSSVCEPNCASPVRCLSIVCGKPKCECKDGYVRNGEGVCVTKNNCPLDECPTSTNAPTTTTITPSSTFTTTRSGVCTKLCTVGHHCIIDCAGQQQCIPNNPCDGYTCPYGQKCTVIQPKCFCPNNCPNCPCPAKPKCV